MNKIDTININAKILDKIDAKIDIKNEINDTIEAGTLNRTLIVGPSFCGKTYLLSKKKIKLLRLDKPEHQIKRINISPQQYENIENQDVSVEKHLADF